MLPGKRQKPALQPATLTGVRHGRTHDQASPCSWTSCYCRVRHGVILASSSTPCTLLLDTSQVARFCAGTLRTCAPTGRRSGGAPISRWRVLRQGLCSRCLPRQQPPQRYQLSPSVTWTRPGGPCMPSRKGALTHATLSAPYGGHAGSHTRGARAAGQSAAASPGTPCARIRPCLAIVCSRAGGRALTRCVRCSQPRRRPVQHLPLRGGNAVPVQQACDGDGDDAAARAELRAAREAGRQRAPSGRCEQP